MNYIILIAFYIFGIFTGVKGFIKQKRRYEEFAAAQSENWEKYFPATVYVTLFLCLGLDIWAALTVSNPIVTIGVAGGIVFGFYNASRLIKSVREKTEYIYGGSYLTRTYCLALDSYILYLLVLAVIS